MAQDDIQGTVTDSAGDPIEGAIVALIPNDGSDGDDVIYTTTDSNGDYIFDAHPQGDGTTQEWHVMARYDDGSGEFNSLSLPYVSADLPETPTIPDSAVHHWQFDEGSGSTAADDIGTSDGSINGASWVSGTWIGDNALDGDGTDDYVAVGSLGSYGSGMDSFAWAFTFQTSDNGKLLGGGISGNSAPRAFAGFTTDWDPDNNSDALQFTMVAENGRSTVNTDSDFNDGSKHRAVITTDSVNPSDLEIWIDGTEQSVTQSRDEGNFDPENFDAFRFFSSAEESDLGYIDAVMDDILFTDSKMTSNEIQDDFDRQPWS